MEVLVRLGDERGYQGARIKQLAVTAVECVDTTVEVLNPIQSSDLHRPIVLIGPPKLSIDGIMHSLTVATPFQTHIKLTEACV